MSGTGYSALAHLFEYANDQSQTAYKNTFSEVMEAIRVKSGDLHGNSSENRLKTLNFFLFMISLRRTMLALTVVVLSIGVFLITTKFLILLHTSSK